jgi:predicted glycosyltransferase
MAPPQRLFIWVQHLLGIGHLMRAAHIARHLAAAGWDVTLASGGIPVALADFGGARLCQLPPVKAADADFSALFDEGGRPLDDAFRAERARRLLAAFAGAAPDALLFEHYPFGRAQLSFELAPLLEAARRRTPRPAIVASVRDILVRRKPAREAATAALVARDFDAVLVHGDPLVAPLAASFGPAEAIAGKLIYTGYIGGGEARRASDRDGQGEIIVSAGGGAVGAALIEAAFGAAPRLGPRRRWRVLIGAAVAEETLADLRRRAPQGVAVERARVDFRALLSHAALSISQAGYNTVVDLLAAGVPAVLVPFARGRETEQSLRAARLAALGLARTIEEAALSPASLAAAAEAALAAPRAPATVALGGEAATAAALDRLVSRPRGRRAS